MAEVYYRDGVAYSYDAYVKKRMYYALYGLGFYALT